MITILGIEMSDEEYAKINDTIINNFGMSWNNLNKETKRKNIRDILVGDYNDQENLK